MVRQLKPTANRHQYKTLRGNCIRHRGYYDVFQRGCRKEKGQGKRTWNMIDIGYYDVFFEPGEYTDMVQMGWVVALQDIYVCNCTPVKKQICNHTYMCNRQMRRKQRMLYSHQLSLTLGVLHYAGHVLLQSDCIWGGGETASLVDEAFLQLYSVLLQHKACTNHRNKG